MKTFIVYDGTYPFKEEIGTVTVFPCDTPEEEANDALEKAIQIFGGHPVVAPA